MNLYRLKISLKKQIFRFKYFLRFNLPDVFWQKLAKKIQNSRSKFYEEKIKSYGFRNPNKTYFVIRRRPPAWGFFSNVIFVIQGLIYAEKKGLIPVVDMENYWVGELSTNKKINGSHNAWCYFFEQTSNNRLDDIYRSRNVVLSSGTSIMGQNYWMNDRKFMYATDTSKLNIMKEIIYRYIKLNLNTMKFIEQASIKLNWANENAFGVFVRGTGYTSYDGAQPQLPQITQYMQTLENLLKIRKIEKIYVATEDFRIYKKFLEYFGSSVVIPSLRYKKDLEVKNWEESQSLTFDHAILMGYEKTLCYLTETILLSQCSNYICNLSNASVFTLALSNQEGKNRWVIQPNQVTKLNY